MAAPPSNAPPFPPFGQPNPTTINQEYFQALIQNRSSSFSFPVLKNFVASCYEELAKAGRDDRPEKTRYFIYHSGVQLIWPAISAELASLEPHLAEGQTIKRAMAIYNILKPMLQQCKNMHIRMNQTKSGDMMTYDVQVDCDGVVHFPADPNDIKEVIRLAEEEAYRKLNCEASKKFALSVLLLITLGLFKFDYAIEVKETGTTTKQEIKDESRAFGGKPK